MPDSLPDPLMRTPLRRVRAWVRTHRRKLGTGAVLAGMTLGLLLVALARPLATGRLLEPDASPELLDRTGATLHVFLNGDQQWCLPRGLHEISPWLLKATIAAEDQRFRGHPGVDPIAIARALGQDLRHGRIVSGASTLEMQVVKLAGLDSSTPSGKLRQAWGALRLAAHASKDDVLGAYLNRAPYGLNLVGCEAAARRYFGKPAAELTLPEAALLAGLPKSPVGLMPLDRPARARVRRNAVLGRMLDEAFITPAEAQRAAAAPLGVDWHAFPTAAPHVAMALRPEIPRRARFATTLDAGIQNMALAGLRGQLADLAGASRPGPDSGAVIVVDTASARVLARVGSPDFFDAARDGQFDAAQAGRSPGSTLKPFIYALAMQRNRLFPDETLLDDTFDLGRYNPQDFDGRYRGLVSAGAALRQSLNVPALLVFGRIGGDPLLGLLRRAGLTTLDRGADRYGAGLALGNCEARLDQLAGAYTMLANLGAWRPLQLRADAPASAPIPLLDAGAALAVDRMLRQPLPDEPDQQAAGLVGTLTPVAWKTGTSTGNRDAWAFVFNRHYVVGVWIGNHDGRSNPQLVGAGAALPLAASIFRRLPTMATPAWPDATGMLHPIRVCALSGLPATPWCPHTREVLVPRDTLLTRRCDVHWPVAGAAEGGSFVAARSAASFPALIERWPGRATDWDLADVRVPWLRPAATPGTTAADAASIPHAGGVTSLLALSILDPADGARFVLTGEPHGDRLQPRTSIDAQTGVAWFLDDRYLGRATLAAPLTIPLTTGAHKLVAVAAGHPPAITQFEVVPPARALNFR